MSRRTPGTRKESMPSAEKAMILALRLLHAENALQKHVSGQLDAVVDRNGHTFLLRSAQERLRLREEALGEISQGVLICDENRLITYANAGFTTLTGYPENEVVGRSCAILQGPDTDPATVLMIRAALNARETFEGEILNYRKNGQAFWNELSITPLHGTDGQPLRFIGVQRDISERKRAVSALKEGEFRYRALFENMLEGYAYCRLLLEQGQPRDLIYLEVNSAFESLTGLKNVIGRKISELVPGIRETNPEILEAYGRVTSTGHPEKFETCVKPLGIWLSISVYRPEKDHFVAVFDNITDRKEAEAVMRRERALLRALIDSIPDLIFFKNRKSEFLGCNKAFERHFGCLEEELIGLPDNDLAHGELAGTYRQQDEILLASGAPQRTEDWLPSSDGNGGFFETVKTPYYGPSGESLGLVGVSRDITERKRSDENRRVIGERLKLAAEAGQVGIWEMNAATHIMEWDAQMRVLYGLPAEVSDDVIGQINRTMHPDDLARVTEEFEGALLSEAKPLNTEYRIIRASDGCRRVIRSMATVIRDDAGKPLRIVGTNWDVTEERTREEKLAAALAQEKQLVQEAQAGNRAKSEFLAVMSHEIRTPMNGILGFSELLAGTPDLPDDCLDYVKTISSSGEALLRILDDILDFSRLEAAGVEIEKTVFSPREIVQSIYNLFAPRAAEKSLELKIDLADGLPDYLWNDAGRLRQILLNLAGNAIKFTERGSVTLGMRSLQKAARPHPAMVEFFVQDTGPGIPGDKLDHIFEPFAQADSSISRRFGGAGLGLSISRNLVELMGGSLTVGSNVGGGAEFRVDLPTDLPGTTFVPVQDPVAEVLDETFAANHPLVILLVEDDLVNLKLMRMLLRKLGYEPQIAQDGVEAVEICGRELPDCILMDLQMPRKDGLQATLEIRALENLRPKHGHVFIAALTANIVAEDRKRCFEVGMDGYMNKPIKSATLARTLKQASAAKSAA